MAEMCHFCNLRHNLQTCSTLIAEFEHSFALLNFDQENYPGQSLLVFKEHYEHLHKAPIVLQQAVVPELAQLTAAILKAFGGFRANHESLGNGVAHVHWHIIPRYPNDVNAGGPPLMRREYHQGTDEFYRQQSQRIRDCLEPL